MQNTVTNTVQERKSAEPQVLLKRVGSTNFFVTVHFSQTSKESLEDKLLRLMEREAKDHA